MFSILYGKTIKGSRNKRKIELPIQKKITILTNSSNIQNLSTYMFDK